MLHRRRHSCVMLHWTHTGIKVELLPHGYVERTDTTADGRCQRAFDRDTKVLCGPQSIFRQPIPELCERLFTSEDFVPGNTTFTAISLMDGSIEDSSRCLPDVPTGAITFDKGNNRIVGHTILPILVTNGRAFRWNRDAVVYNSHEQPLLVTL